MIKCPSPKVTSIEARICTKRKETKMGSRRTRYVVVPVTNKWASLVATEAGSEQSQVPSWHTFQRNLSMAKRFGDDGAGVVGSGDGFGEALGRGVGQDVGSHDGFGDGAGVGNGDNVGSFEGVDVGTLVGCCEIVGAGVGHPTVTPPTLPLEQPTGRQRSFVSSASPESRASWEPPDVVLHSSRGTSPTRLFFVRSRTLTCGGKGLNASTPPERPLPAKFMRSRSGRSDVRRIHCRAKEATTLLFGNESSVTRKALPSSVSHETPNHSWAHGSSTSQFCRKNHDVPRDSE
mmetsp:Transcript_3576/g.11725  ORF Transcript_3576/g.11725 Transcript_3576/m.11725 type:complete len:290 (+) Transcript_3576:2942-3811(+)